MKISIFQSKTFPFDEIFKFQISGNVIFLKIFPQICCLSIRGSYLAFRIGQNHPSPAGSLLATCCSPAAACLLLPACCCVRLPVCLSGLLCLLCLPGLLWLPLPPLGLAGGPAGGLSPLPRLEITLIRPCRTMRKYAVKRDVDVATLRPFGQFLYPAVHWASKIGHCDPKT